MSQKRSSKVKDIYEAVNDKIGTKTTEDHKQQKYDRFSSLSSTTTNFESDNFDEILRNNNHPIHRKCWRLFKICSIFKTSNGIFH